MIRCWEANIDVQDLPAEICLNIDVEYSIPGFRIYRFDDEHKMQELGHAGELYCILR